MTAPAAGPMGGGEQRVPDRRGLFSAFAYREFRLLWTGLFVSYFGNWMQFTSLTYLVGVVLAGDAAHSAFNLGLLGAARSVPVLLLAPLSGYVADRFPRRRTLMIVNSTQTVLAFVLAFVSEAHGGWVLAAVYAIAASQAAAQCFEAPARQSWVPSLVPRHLLSNAIGLFSVAFNAPMMIGPAFGGILIGTVGVSPSFFANAFLTLAVLAALVAMRPAPPGTVSRGPVLRQIGEGLRFVSNHPVLRWVVLLMVLNSLLVRPFNQLLAAYAAHVLFVGAKAYGTLLAAGGIGTLAGALLTAFSRSERRALQWFGFSLLAGASLIALALTTNYYVALALQVSVGLGVMLTSTATNILMQTHSPDEMRGRTMALYSNVQQCFVPLGTLVIGALGSQIGLPPTFAIAGAIAMAAALCMWGTQPVLRRA